ncbi:TRAP transporter small permease [Hoeflea sp.]|uniref:TRAP transporter small permease n=1 Tax=Hoeflea sp. TaxID=1940281 RepID=UPI0025C0AB85|nr:TRAP transporter small permease [Hoeflea sp.]
MSSSRHDLVHSASVEWTVRVLTLASSLALGVLLLMTFAGVVMRYFFNAPILGNNEIIELASVVVVMLAMPSAAQKNMHIRVDVFDGPIGAFGRFAGDILTRGISIYLLALLGWRAWGKLADAAEYGDVTNMLSIPLWPFYGLLVLGAALYAIVLAIQLVDILRSGVASNE